MNVTVSSWWCWRGRREDGDSAPRRHHLPSQSPPAALRPFVPLAFLPPMTVVSHGAPGECAECNKDVVSCFFFFFFPSRPLSAAPPPVASVNSSQAVQAPASSSLLLLPPHLLLRLLLSSAQPVDVDSGRSHPAHTHVRAGRLRLHLNSSAKPSQPPERKSDFSG